MELQPLKYRALHVRELFGVSLLIIHTAKTLHFQYLPNIFLLFWLLDHFRTACSNHSQRTTNICTVQFHTVILFQLGNENIPTITHIGMV